MAIYTFPYVYIMIANTLGLIASDLEEAASIHGANRARVALTITLPMVLPAILSGFILSVLQALALFGSPAILALPAAAAPGRNTTTGIPAVRACATGAASAVWSSGAIARAKAAQARCWLRPMSITCLVASACNSCRVKRART